ncbi:class I SAM-dependent methyltransferase [Patescibacteria group bacterium]|nr:class I SAM-dependent methyltransferase [Patescibacteria group bacterium]MCG2700305.1 class I SAM-dependent methyltransferase [Candidatus Parcubacteria bacterium]
MPSSYPKNISTIICEIKHLMPKKVLDIGPGFGKYGLLCREYLEIWNLLGYRKKEWKTRIDAIEVFSKYITPVHKYIYNNIYIGDAQKIIPKLKIKYDVSLLIDVLEHFTKIEGKRLLNNLKKKSKTILVAIPRKPGKQKKVFGNKYETHKALWSRKELVKAGAKKFLNSENSWICLICNK